MIINWQPDSKSPLPLYRQIYSFIRDKILTGQWPAGTCLPPQRSFALTLQVNRSTLCTALDELSADGFIKSRRGSGSLVTNNAWTKFSREPANWNPYLYQTAVLSNLPMIQTINQKEFDPGMIRLGTGELSPDLLPHKELKALFPAAVTNIPSFGYQEPLGLLELRQEISRHLQKNGIQASPDSILIVSGALQALQLIFFGLLPPRSRIFVEQPSYLHSLKMLQSGNLQFSSIPVSDEGISLSSLYFQQKKSPHALFYTIPSFQNPTGNLLSTEKRKQLLTLCQKLQLPILEDNVYSDLWLNKPSPPPLKSLDHTGSVLLIDSLSKAIGPGLRIGWIVGPEAVIARLGDLKMQHDYGCSILSQWMAKEWLQSNLHQQHMTRLRQELKRRQQLTDQLLQRCFCDIADWQLPDGGFYIWLHLKKTISLHTLFEQALQKKILLNPGCIYHPLDTSHLRISIAYASDEELHYALPELAELIKKLSAAS